MPTTKDLLNQLLAQTLGEERVNPNFKADKVNESINELLTALHNNNVHSVVISYATNDGIVSDTISGLPKMLVQLTGNIHKEVMVNAGLLPKNIDELMEKVKAEVKEKLSAHDKTILQ